MAKHKAKSKSKSKAKSSSRNHRENHMSATVTHSSSTQTSKEVEKQQAADLKAAMLQAAQSMVKFKVLAPFAACLVTPDQLQDAIDAKYPEIYITVNGQLFKRMQLTGGRHVQLEIEELPKKFSDATPLLTTTAVTEEFNFLPAGKIPGEYWDQIVEFFRQVMRKTKQEYEAHAWILWSEEKGYFISVPKQTVSKAAVRFSYDEEALPPGSVIVVDIHSHNTMGAFYSGTDNNNDKDGIYYSGVVGKISDNSYDWVMRFNLHDIKRQVDLDEIFDMEKSVEIPKHWLDQVDVTQARGKGSQPDYSKYVQPQQAKWNFGGSKEQKGGAGNETSGNTPFREYPSLWDTVGVNGAGQSFRPIEAHGALKSDNSEVSVISQRAARRREMEDLLGNIPDQQELELDRQAEAFLLARGYDSDGRDILTNATDTDDDTLDLVRSMRTATEIEFTEEYGDPVGSNDPDELHSEEYEAILEKHGKKAADAYEFIDAILTDLEGCDEGLLDLAKTCYHLMSEEGQAQLQTNGF